MTEEGENRILFEDPVTAVEVPYTSLLTAAVIDGLRVRYPFLKSGEIGKSVMGKPIWYLEIGNGEKEVFYNASFHANESITTPVLLRFAEEYAQAYERRMALYGVPAAELFEEYRLFLVPLVNPDGVDLVNGRLQTAGISGGRSRLHRITVNSVSVRMEGEYRGHRFKSAVSGRLGKRKEN